MNNSNRQKVTIGGKIYDAKTGELLQVAKKQLRISSQPSCRKNLDGVSIKRRQKPASTLNRDFVKSPNIKVKTPTPIIKKRACSTPAILSNEKPSQAIRQTNFQSRQIRHFVSLEEAKQINSRQPVVISEVVNPDIKVSATQNQQFRQIINQARQTDFLTRYRMNQIARQRRAQELQTIRQLKTSYRKQSTLPQVSAADQELHNRAIKNSVFARALANAPTSEQLAMQQVARSKNNFIKRHLSTLIGTFTIVLLGAYLTYLNLPNISIRIAASQAGIDAKYPEYKPSGYNISKLPSTNDNQVTVEYRNNQQILTLTQQASSFDSKTILENIVKKYAGEAYETDQTKGLTIYSYNNQSTWINGGILYTLAYNSTLSRDQISKIATSL
ncbi:MAG: DUF4367 domain-containing protein [Candidatus Saccharibacteria bacterium]|nr:DUF4367 domain-containing protein [Candidatus Saccharibacteria bacterium]